MLFRSLSFNLEAGIPLGSFSLDPGLRYRRFTAAVVDADYIPQRQNPYVSTEETASALGLFVDFQYFRLPFFGASGLNLTTGLDVDNSTVTLKAATKSDDATVQASGVTASADSKLTVISLRLGAGVDLLFAKVFGVTAGLTVMVPMTEVGKKFSGSLTDADSSRVPADSGKDLQAALDHKKNSVAYEIGRAHV